MVQPIDYMGMLPQVDLGQSLLSGIQAGAAIRQVRDQRAEQERAAQMHEQFSSDLQGALANPNAQNFAALTAKYPQMSKAFKQSWDMLSDEQRNSEFRAGTQVFHALQTGNVDAAKSVLNEHITAMRNSGQDVSDLENISRQIDTDPKSAQGFVGLVLSSTDPERWGKIASEQRAAQEAPFELTEKAAKAQKAAVDARFAESKAAQDLEKGGWQIQKLANDIGVSKLNSQIALMNAQLGREQNDLKKQELQVKLDERLAKRDEAIRAKVATVEQSRGTIDNSLSTIDRVLKNPALDSVVGAVEGSEYYPSTLVGLIPGTASADDRANALADIDTLKSQTFLTQLQAMKAASTTGASGLGALTEKEGERLINGVQSLRTKQGEKQFKDNLQEVQRLLLKARTGLADRYGVPDVIPDRPNLESQPASSGFRVLGVE